MQETNQAALVDLKAELQKQTKEAADLRKKISAFFLMATGVTFIDHAHELLLALFSPGQNEPKLLKPDLDLHVLLYFGVLQFVLNWGIRGIARSSTPLKRAILILQF